MDELRNERPNGKSQAQEERHHIIPEEADLREQTSGYETLGKEKEGLLIY